MDREGGTPDSARLVLGNIQRITQNAPAFRAFLRKRLGDEAVVEDLYQQCLLRAIEREHSLDNEDSVIPWFYRILRNALIDYYRTRAAHETQRMRFEREAEVLQSRE